MSGHAVSALLAPPAKAYGAELNVAIAIADRCDEHGRGCWAGIEDLARRANICHFGETGKPSDDAEDAEKADYRRARENAMRSTKRALGALVGRGVVVEEGTSRFGTICRGLHPDIMSGPDTRSGTDAPDSGHQVREPDTMSGEGDDRSGGPDTMSPKPSLEPSGEPSSKPETAVVAGAPARDGLPPDTSRGKEGYPVGEDDARRVAAQREHNSSLSMYSGGGGEPPAIKRVEAIDDAKERFSDAEVGSVERLEAYQALVALGAKPEEALA